MITIRHEHLYGIKRFDNYKNIYAVKVNKYKLNNITNYVLNSEKLNYEYNIIKQELILYFSIEKNINIKDCYKIIYGHFYNNSNDFLYQKLNKDKKINIETYRCNKNNLLHDNKNKYLIYSSSYDNLDKQLIDLSNKELNIINQTVKPFTILYDSEIVTINTHENSNITFIYENECLVIH